MIDNVEVVDRHRAAVVIVRDGLVAVIHRNLGADRWYLFPGGGVDAGETPEAAAVREAREELGLDVILTGVVAQVRFRRAERLSVQTYFAAAIAGGEFGTGHGPELSLPADHPSGSYEPIWLPLEDFGHLDCRPAPLFAHLAGHGIASLLSNPLMLEEMSEPV